MRWIVTAVLALTTALTMADHGTPAPARTGFGWTPWLLIVGAIVAVSLAAWAVFATDRPEGRPRSTIQDGSEPEPPAR
jgi:hypothetical protein